MTARSLTFTEHNGRVGISEEMGKLIINFYPPSPNWRLWQENTLYDIVIAVQHSGTEGEELEINLGDLCELIRAKPKKRFVPNMEGTKVKEGASHE